MHPPSTIMGILNITPDSFSDGGDYYNDVNAAVKHAKDMLAEGADIIDIGGESTRPGSELVSKEEELARVLPVIKAIKQALPQATLSIDTWKHTVADQALTAGCTIVNSLGGFTFDTKLAAIVAKHNSTIVTYHTKGKPKTMQENPTYTDVILEIQDFFTQQLAIGKQYGITQKQFILDPGIGFGKTLEQNIEIIKRLDEFQQFHLPILIGVSRKSHLGMLLKNKLTLETQPTERLAASLAETAVAVSKGASIIRTHDVSQTKRFITVLAQLL